MKPFDFSCKHHILLQDRDGTLQPMDEPYFRAEQIAPGTWKILSDGDYSYLLEGDEEALVIDSGYGAGDIRAFCQTLTSRPVRRIANTHHHFDHTANNGYFELAYMSPETKPLATIPFPSFEGIYFPRDYAVQLVDDGDMIPLKGRELLVLKMPDHAVGSIAFLDRRERMLFSGDELMIHGGKDLNGTVEQWLCYMERLAQYREQFDTICAGGGLGGAEQVDAQLIITRRILDGFEGECREPAPFPNFAATAEDGRTIWKRCLPHPGDGPDNWDAGKEYRRSVDHGKYSITYDIRRVRSSEEVSE